jgi:hypothetical protein
MTTILTPIDREQYLIGNIPYRLESLRFCYRVCELNRTPHPDYGDELAIGEFLHLDDTNRHFINPIIESGLVYCRVLLEFLGVGRDRKTGALRPTKSKDSTDICISDFGLPLVSVSEATSAFSYATSSEINTALGQVIEAANKTVAHLTSGPTHPGTFPTLQLACRIVIDLVIRHLYLPLNERCIVSPISEKDIA